MSRHLHTLEFDRNEGRVPFWFEEMCEGVEKVCARPENQPDPDYVMEDEPPTEVRIEQIGCLRGIAYLGLCYVIGTEVFYICKWLYELGKAWWGK